MSNVVSHVVLYATAIVAGGVTIFIVVWVAEMERRRRSGGGGFPSIEPLIICSVGMIVLAVLIPIVLRIIHDDRVHPNWWVVLAFYLAPIVLIGGWMAKHAIMAKHGIQERMEPAPPAGRRSPEPREATGEHVCAGQVLEHVRGRVVEVKVTSDFPVRETLKEEVAQHRPQWLVVSLVSAECHPARPQGKFVAGSLVEAYTALRQVNPTGQVRLIASGELAQAWDRFGAITKIGFLWGNRTYPDLEAALAAT